MQVTCWDQTGAPMDYIYFGVLRLPKFLHVRRSWGALLCNFTNQWGRVTWHVSWQLVLFISNSQVLIQYNLCPWKVTIAFKAWCEDFAIALDKIAVLENWYIVVWKCFDSVYCCFRYLWWRDSKRFYKWFLTLVIFELRHKLFLLV